LTRYCLGTLSTIYYKAQLEILETGNLFYGLLSRALVGKACYEMLLNRQNSAGFMEAKTSAGLTEVSLDLHLKELFEDQERLDQHELATIRSVLSEGLDIAAEGVVTRKAFVKAFTNSENGTLGDLVDLFDRETSANPCMTLFDSDREKRRKHATPVNSPTGRSGSDFVSSTESLRPQDLRVHPEIYPPRDPSPDYMSSPESPGKHYHSRVYPEVYPPRDP